MERQLAEVVAKMTTVNEQQAEIEREAALNNDNVFTDEQRSQYEALDAMYRELKATKDRLEKDIKLRDSRLNRDDDLKFNVTTRQTPANSGSPLARKAKAGLPIERENEETGETRISFKIPKNVIRLGRPRNFHGVVDGMNAEERAYRFGQWVLARVSQDLPGRYSFPYAKEFVDNYMRPMNTAHSESDATTGGHFLVPAEFNRDLIELRENRGVVRRLFGREPMTSDILHTPKRASGLTAYFVAENGAGTESNMTWSDVTLVAKDVMVLARMSNQLSADAVVSIGDKLAGEIAYAFADKEDECGFNGDGTSTYGGIRGVRQLLTSIDDAGTDSAGLVTQGTSNTWSAIVLGDFNSVVGKLPQYGNTPNTVWVMHSTFYYSVAQKLEMASGGVPMSEIANGDRRPRPMFMGFPVEFSQVFPSATATATVVAALGDFQVGAMFGDRQQTTIAFSEHASIGGENVFERNQIAIRGTERMDINVHGCGTSAVVGPIVGLRTGN